MGPDATPADAAPPEPAPPCADAEAALAAFYAERGGPDAFSAHFRFALEGFARAEAELCAGDPAAAAARLDTVWARYPVGDRVWFSAGSGAHGTNAGDPVAYYALRMLQDVVDHALAGPHPAPRPARLTVILPGCAEGVQPRTFAELEAGEGVMVRHALDPALLAADHAVLRASLDLFGRYVSAITEGQLELALRFVSLPDVCVPVYTQAAPYRQATIRSPGPALAALPAEITDDTDWWMVIYPSHVPEQFPDFAGVEFISGGMGLHPNGGPLWLADDRWFLRKPPHLGDGPYSEIERRAYLPQWLQHEFFHHLFRLYPEHGLEAESHQWFDRQTWPADFEGIMEPDYYAEALHRRMQGSDPSLAARLTPAADAPPGLWAGLTADDVIGTYARLPIQNPWHEGRVVAEADGLRWRNEAGVSWSLGDAIAEGRLRGGPDNPYFGDGADVDFHLELARDAEGRFRAEVIAFRFGGERYLRQ